MNEHLKKNLDVIGILLLMIPIFSLLYLSDTDIPIHARIAKEMLEGGNVLSGNFLLYLLLNIGSLFTGNGISIAVSLIIILSLSETAKYVITREVFKKITNANISKLCAASLLLVYVIPLLCFLKPFGIFQSHVNMYLGYLVPNVWHNSTIIFMMPFSMGLYFLSVKQLREFSVKRNIYMILLSVVCVLVKPSFFFIFVVVWLVMAFWRYKFMKEFWLSILPILAGGICTLYVYLTIFEQSTDGSGVVISLMPMLTIEFWNNKILYLLISLSLPIIFIGLYGKTIKDDFEFWYVSLLLAVALGISWVCQETGSRANHGNFGWQIIAAMWFVYYYMQKHAIIAITSNSLSFKYCIRNKVFLTLYSIHTMMGFAYLCKIIIFNDLG